MALQLGALVLGTLVAIACLWLGTKVVGVEPDLAKIVSISGAANLVYVFVPFLGNPAAVLVLFALLAVWAKVGLRAAAYISIATHGMMFV